MKDVKVGDVNMVEIYDFGPCVVQVVGLIESAPNFCWVEVEASLNPELEPEGEHGCATYIVRKDDLKGIA